MTAFDQDISNWNTSNVEDMSFMFFMSHFNKPINTDPITGAWNVSNVEDMSHMFNGR